MSLGRKKHSPRFRRGTRTSPSQSWTAVVLFLVRMSSRAPRSEEHTSELQSQSNLVCRLLLEKKTRHHLRCAPINTTVMIGIHGRTGGRPPNTRVLDRTCSSHSLATDECIKSMTRHISTRSI